MEAGRELDALVAEKVFGLCPGSACYVDAEEIGDKYRAKLLDEWRTKYQMEPPAEWVDEEVQCHVYSETSGDYSPMKCGKCGGQPHPTLPHYSLHISDAWRVVEKFQDFNVYRCAHGYEATVYGSDDRGDWQVNICAPTTPLAICLAALKAVGYEPDKETR